MIFCQCKANVRWDNDGFYKGNSPLTVYGLSQIKKLGGEFARVPIDHIYASPLDRAINTAQAIVDAHEGEPLNLQIDPQIREQDLGPSYYEALAVGDRDLAYWIRAGDPQYFTRHFKPEGGESYEHLSDRARTVLLKLIPLHGIVTDSIPEQAEGLDSKSSDPPAGIPHIVLVSHNLFIGEFYDLFLNWNCPESYWKESGFHWPNAYWFVIRFFGFFYKLK